MKLSIGYITSRDLPRFDWFIKTLAPHLLVDDRIEVIVVDAGGGIGANRRMEFERAISSGQISLTYRRPKPTVWQGAHRITNEDWWAAANARNTAICVCQTEWFACVDDRLWLGPEWLNAVRSAMAGEYAVCGSYVKVDDKGTILGEDCRRKYLTDNNIPLDMPFACPGNWWFGASTAVPLEWALAIGGYEQACDGMGMEDIIFGIYLANAGYRVFYDARLHVSEDRTPGQLGPVMRREDKGVSPNDKSHALLALLKDRKECLHSFQLRDVRELVQAGGQFPLPYGPFVDWYDGQKLGDM